MATKKGRKPNEGEILAMLSEGVAVGIKFTDSKLSKERRRVLDYYAGLLPAPVHGGNSRYISTDVFDAVEGMKADLLEAFSAHSDIVSFSADGPEDAQDAEVATAYVKHVVFEQNPGHEIFNSVIHDGLTARVGVAKVYWDACTDKSYETFEDLDEVALTLLMQQPDVDDLEDVEETEPGVFSGTICRKVDKGQVRIEPIPAEEFIVNPNIKSLADADRLDHRTEKSRSDLIKEGYDKAKVQKLSHTDTDLEQDPERVTRFYPVSDDSRSGKDGQREGATEKFIVYETYVHADLDGEGITTFWRVVWSSGVILEKEPVDRHPFITFVPLPVPHSFFGGNFAARVIPTQNAKTILTRSILDHAVVANNPRYGVVKGALTNPRELIDNRIGGIVNVTRQDGIFPLPQAPLNPFIFQTIQMLDEDKEDITGVSRLSQGLNKDAISNQNSQGLVEQLIGASMKRTKTIARAFAAQFLAPLFIEAYRLVAENEKQERIIEVAGNYKPVDPQAWSEQRKVTIDFRLGYGERERMASEYLAMGQVLAQDPAIQHLYTPTERYNVYRKFLETKGHKDVQAFIKDPATTEPPQPDPMMLAELDLRKAQAETVRKEVALHEAKQQIDAAFQKQNADMDARFKALENLLKMHDSERKDRETDNRIEVAHAEMELAREAEAKSPDENTKTSAIISPNG